MDYSGRELQEKIDDCFSGIISKAELGEWADCAYYDLLKGGYIESEKIVIYPFLMVVAKYHIEENDKDDIYPCNEESVKMIQDILHGKRNFEFTVEISVPDQIYSMFSERSRYLDEKRREEYRELRNMIADCLAEKCTLSREIKTKIDSVMCLQRQDKIILDLLEKRIKRLINVYFNKDYAELELCENLKLYAQKSEHNIIAERLIDYLDCYIGNRNFQLLIAYKEGEAGIFIEV